MDGKGRDGPAQVVISSHPPINKSTYRVSTVPLTPYTCWEDGGKQEKDGSSVVWVILPIRDKILYQNIGTQH